MKLDRLEIGILDAPQKDATQSTTEIAASVGLSQSPCWRRISLMEEAKNTTELPLAALASHAD